MRVISMVPSWTETLLACGAEVVGRTRFCIHPGNLVRDIQAVGGTKDIDWEKTKALRPDLLLLDREENPKAMSEESPCRVHSTHVTSAKDVAVELDMLAERFEREGESEADRAVATRMRDIAERWRRVKAASQARADDGKGGITFDWDRLPGLIEWLDRPQGASERPQDFEIAYVIWKKPWMAASRGTFISSVLQLLGWPEEKIWANASGDKYPLFELDQIPPETVLLCSSEPYPFHKKRSELAGLGRPIALVEGEGFSWFGIRALIFLEKSLGLTESRAR